MTQTLSNSAQKIQDFLQSKGMSLEVKELADSARTAAEAAATIGCSVEQIAKSLVFMTSDTKEPILVVASGTNRVDEKKLSALISHPIQKATAEFVLAKTGFAIGGIPPIGHKEKIRTIIDQDLLALPEIWAAAGTPRAVFRLIPTQLTQLIDGQVACIA